MKKGALIILFFASVIFYNFNIISADVVSINAGGSDEIVVNPDNYIEGFFSGVQVLSQCGNNILEAPYEECDDGNYNSGDGCSATCKIEEGPEPPPEEEECNTDEDCHFGEICIGGECISSGELFIRVDPREIKRSMLINTNIEETIGITNLNKTSVTFSVYSRNFDPDLIVSFWDQNENQWVDSFSLTIAPRGISELRIRFSAPGEVGFYNGSILADGVTIPVSLNVQEKLLLFDSNIIVLNEDYRVPQGEKLRTSVTLIPLGDKERMDVTLNYIIKDYDGKVYLTRSETVLVEEQVNFKRNFDTGVLPYGSYIIALELIYPNGVAPSSAHFEVVEGKQSTLFGRIVFFLINMILIILILIILLTIWRIIKQMRDKRKGGEKYFDLVITGAGRGGEKKDDLLNTFTVSCKGKQNSELLDIGKVETKEKEEMEIDLQRLNDLLKPLVVSEKDKEVKIKPALVVEVMSKEIQESSDYNSGWALKSPRITEIKSGKSVSSITKLKEIEREFKLIKEEPKDKEKILEKEKPKEEENPKDKENPKK
ncbi:MAG: DUF4215 domain-containing protein [Nanobdellota archaeon]